MKLLILIAALLLAGMMYYSYAEHDRYYPSISDFAKNPEKYDGMITEHQMQVYNITNESFMARFGDDSILVKYQNAQKPKFGMLTVLGYYKKEGYIQAIKIRYNNYNNGKYILSVFGLFLFLIIFFREWKITLRGFENA